MVTQLKKTSSFRGALQLHKNFLATVARLAMVDNAVVQDGIDRVIQVNYGKQEIVDVGVVVVAVIYSAGVHVCHV